MRAPAKEPSGSMCFPRSTLASAPTVSSFTLATNADVGVERPSTGFQRFIGDHRLGRRPSSESIDSPCSKSQTHAAMPPPERVTLAISRTARAG
jgi:hypothetical protein